MKNHLCKGAKVKRLKGTAKINGYLLAGFLFGLVGPVMAEHGPLTTIQRDGWIDSRVQDLVSAGLVSQPEKPLKDLTNLEVAQLAKTATENWYAQVPSASTGNPPAAGKSLKDLVEEFKGELESMDVDVAKLEDRIYDQQYRNERFAAWQMEDLKRTGTNASGYSRSYFDTYRGFGPNAVYGPMDYNDIMFADMRLHSVPVPFVLFDADIRLTRTIGLYYADPINPFFDLRWLSLSDANEVCNVTAGDFYRHYTPLTLNNSEIPLYTLVEPTPYHRVRKDVEELVYMDHGSDWHLRGFEAASDQAVKDPVFSSFHLQAMGGELQSATPYSFANNYAGSEGALDFFDDNLEIKGAGLLLWDDTGTANVPYLPNLISTFAHTYQIGSLSSHATLPVDKDFSVKGDVEYAGSWYQDDSRNAQSVIQDWALLAGGSVNYQGAHLTVKYINNGAYFYSPGAQTNRFSASPGTGYISFSPTALPDPTIDDGLQGYLNNYAFQGVNRPSFAGYDRMAENMLPYGDATPDRIGFVFGFSADIGKDGWLKPQAAVAVNMHEIQPNYVLTGSGNSVLPVDSGVPSTSIRQFGDYEGALTIDFAKALEGMPATCDLMADYKHQTTDLGLGASPFSVDTFLIGADAGPFPQVPLLDGLVLSLAFEQAQSTGSEYTLNGIGSPPTVANYAAYFDSGSIGGYTYQALDITRTSWAFGARLPLSSTFDIHGDCFINQYTWTDVPAFDRREQIWRITYEVSF